MQAVRGKARGRAAKNLFRKSEKSLQKCLTNEIGCDRINKLSERKATKNRSNGRNSEKNRKKLSKTLDGRDGLMVS